MTIAAPLAAPSSRERALTAARHCLLEIGASRTTMVEVARRAGIGRTTLYRNWNDVSELFVDLLTRELTEAVATTGDDPRDAEELVRMVCDLADHLRTDPLLAALRRHEPEILAIYLIHRMGTSQRHLVAVLRERLSSVARTDPRLAGRDPDTVAHMLFLALQGVVLGAPLADPPLAPDTWRAELDRLVKGYLGL